MEPLPTTGRVTPTGPVGAEASTSAVSWAAIIGGAFVAAAVSIILLILGSGLGFMAVSPWANAGISATAFTVWTGIWLIVVQWLASGLGGYLTGRLRTRWVNVHTDEVFFRDTAHGFLTWAVASVIAVVVVASTATSIFSGAAHMATGMAAGAAAGAGTGAGQMAGRGGDSTGYYVDTLFRPEAPGTGAAATAPAGTSTAGNAAPPAAGPTTGAATGEATAGQNYRAETGRILLKGLTNAEISDTDRTYLAQLIAAHTGVSKEVAEKRIDDVIAQEKAAAAKARQLADEARKAASSLAIFTFFSMLIGAFIACAAAALGGQQRDEHEAMYRTRI
jgi:hypothetical protein